jgi:RimJ/RimL family protein N-acetyltransferase
MQDAAVHGTMQLNSTPRLTFSRLSSADMAEFHRLAQDEHIRRYLLDGDTVERAWCEEQLRASDELFASHGVGIWLVKLREPSARGAIGFCGFIRLVETGPEPQLLYALLSEHTGRGLATEIAKALVDYVREHTSMSVIYSGVDEPNRASVRVLEKVGFVECGDMAGAFGRILQFRLPVERAG